MTLWDVVRALLRRWPVVLVGMVITASAALLAIRDPGVQFTRMQVIFLAPKTWYRNVLQTTPETVMVTASAVAKRVVGAEAVIKYGSLDATLVGTTNSREGVWIRVEDQGGQWAPDIRMPIILVDAVAPTPARVRELQDESVRRIQLELDKLQHELQPGETDRITIEVVPATTSIYRVRGDRTRALGMTGLLGATATFAAVAAIESRHRRRRARVSASD